MREIDFTKEKPQGKYVVLIKTEQCHACQSVKPLVSQLETEFTDMTFLGMEFKEEILPWYKRYIKPEIVREKKEINGVMKEVVSKRVPISFPNFLFFDPQVVTEENPDGFLGNLVGNNPEGLRHILKELTK